MTEQLEVELNQYRHGYVLDDWAEAIQEGGEA